MEQELPRSFIYEVEDVVSSAITYNVTPERFKIIVAEVWIELLHEQAARAAEELKK